MLRFQGSSLGTSSVGHTHAQGDLPIRLLLRPHAVDALLCLRNRRFLRSQRCSSPVVKITNVLPRLGLFSLSSGPLPIRYPRFGSVSVTALVNPSAMSSHSNSS
jgi:hypothetical protein